MSSTRLPQLGSVVWVDLVDPNGYHKVRPAVVLTASSDISAEQKLRVAAITTRLPSPLPEDYVLLRWEREGHTRSGLRRRCAAVAIWIAEVKLEEVKDVVGVLPPVTIEDLLRRVMSIKPQAVNPPRIQRPADDQ